MAFPSLMQREHSTFAGNSKTNNPGKPSAGYGGDGMGIRVREVKNTR